MITSTGTANATGAELVPVVGEFLPVVVETAPAIITGLMEAIGVIKAIGGATYVIAEGYEFIGNVIDLAGDVVLSIDDVVNLFRQFTQGIYFTDNQGEYYIADGDGYRLVTQGDVYLKASSVTNSKFSLPLNTMAVCNTAKAGVSGNHNSWASELGASFMSLGANDIYAVGLFKFQRVNTSFIFYSASTYAFSYSGAQSFEVYQWFFDNPFNDYPLEFQRSLPFDSSWTGSPVWGYSPIQGSTSLRFSENAKWEKDNSGSYINLLSYPPLLTTEGFRQADLVGSEWTYLGHSYGIATSDSPLYRTKVEPLVSTYLLTSGPPQIELADMYPSLSDNQDEFDGGTVHPPTPPDLQPDTEYVPVPPQYWEYWKDIKDLLEHLAGKETNNSTTLGDFIDNGYVYNDVDVNLPEIPDQFTFHIYGDLNVKVDADIDFNVSGSVDFNHKHSGDFAINVNNSYTLPEVSGDDGGVWADMGVADVIEDITEKNPVFPTIKALMESIDPNIRVIFLSAVGLSILVGLWKLIRG